MTLQLFLTAVFAFVYFAPRLHNGSSYAAEMERAPCGARWNFPLFECFTRSRIHGELHFSQFLVPATMLFFPLGILLVGSHSPLFFLFHVLPTDDYIGRVTRDRAFLIFTIL